MAKNFFNSVQIATNNHKKHDYFNEEEKEELLKVYKELNQKEFEAVFEKFLKIKITLDT